jgi:hypothetical protein
MEARGWREHERRKDRGREEGKTSEKLNMAPDGESWNCHITSNGARVASGVERREMEVTRGEIAERRRVGGRAQPGRISPHHPP